MQNLTFDPTCERYVSLATYRRNGAKVPTLVWLTQEDGHLYLFSAGSAGKVKRIRATPQAKMAPCNVRGKVKGAARFLFRFIRQKTEMRRDRIARRMISRAKTPRI
ncbi:MAG: pyridoxamine 5'-phosphate oxidase family protein [Georgfuchsia sp.]